MTLISAWIDSLTLLKPKNLQLFAMVTLKSIAEAYKLLLKYWWWVAVLMVVCVIVPILFPQIDIPDTSDTIFGITRMTFNHFARHIAFFTSQWSYLLLFFATCLATRPSVERKDCAYFRSCMYGFIYAVIFFGLAPKFFWPTAFSVWPIFLILFFLDTVGGPKNFFLSMWYALKMIIFNLPLIAIISICFYLPGYFVVKFVNKAIVDFVFEEDVMNQIFVVVRLIRSAIRVLLLPIGVCTYANIYIKKLHDQFDLYNKQPQG